MPVTTSLAYHLAVVGFWLVLVLGNTTLLYIAITTRVRNNRDSQAATTPGPRSTAGHPTYYQAEEPPPAW